MAQAPDNQREEKRMPAAKGSGLAQQTLVEHALCPLDASEALQSGSMHRVQYQFTDRNRNRKIATANVACPFGLSPHDELFLYGLLALTFSQSDPSPDLFATPHWCLRQLGIVDGDQEQGIRYRLFRDAIRRLAGVVYENDRFYDPMRGEHRSVAFGFLKYSLPADTSSSRAWHISWDPQWFKFCEAMAGSFTFDFALYRSLDCASRRLFLLVSKIFWRNDHTPAFELRELGINTLGFSSTLRTTEIKQKLLQVVDKLIRSEILSLPIGMSDPHDLFVKRSKGVHFVQFHRGAYFDRDAEASQHFTADESPLVDPLVKIGFDQDTIRRIIRKFPARMVAEWSDITLAAVERKIIKESPQAYFQHYIRQAIEQKTTPPDWWRELQKQERERQADTQTSTDETTEEQHFQKYLQTEAKEAFGRVMDKLFQRLHQDGQSEPDARRNAEQFARLHIRRQFRDDHPEFSGADSASLSSLLKRRAESPSSGR
jgi:hypothetical protein